MVSHADRRAAMVAHQLAARDIRDEQVLRAMGEVPREHFVPAHLHANAYDDGPLPIGEGQTISQPYIVALMIQAARIGPGDRVLEIGAGSGYAAAVLSRIAGEVIAIERHSTLASAAAARIEALGYRNCRILKGDGSEGAAGETPFDAILVAAGGSHAPEPVRRQLEIGGRLVMPVGGEAIQSLRRFVRVSEDEWSETSLGQVRFVPLIGTYGRWLDEKA